VGKNRSREIWPVEAADHPSVGPQATIGSVVGVEFVSLTIFLRRQRPAKLAHEEGPFGVPFVLRLGSEDDGIIQHWTLGIFLGFGGMGILEDDLNALEACG
jgi:hypothetical protein